MDDLSKIITENEEANGGMDIHLYFNRQIGYYTAYGISAFLADHIIEGIKSYSEEFQLPVIIIPSGEVASLRNATNKVEHIPHNYYHFQLRNDYVGKTGYAKWANGLKKKV